MITVAAVFAGLLLAKTSRGSAITGATQTNFDKINDAIIAYVSINGRLPCPADPALSTGKANPDVASSTCANPNGVVPWATLSLSQEFAYDGWNHLISYRVFDGPTGLTQDAGASMVNCDTKIPYGPDKLLATGLCQNPSDPQKRNLDTQFLSSKGMQIFKSSTILGSQVAYVLISHGESGAGAYLGSGSRILPLPSNPHELANTNAGSPFYQDDHSSPGIDPNALTYFDDVLSWITINDLIRKSGLGPRDWPDPNPPVIDTTTLTNMDTTGSGHFNATTTTTGETFSLVTPVVASDPVALAYGAGAGGRHASCAWWPTAFRMNNGVDLMTLRMYLEFSTDIPSHAFNGFTIGFLPYRSSTGVATTIDTLLCGDENLGRGLGWDNGSSTSPTYGNLPSPRFAVEFDAARNGSANDPTYNHLAIDFNGTVHSTTASSCSSFGNNYHIQSGTSDCYTANDSTWLRDGLSKFHRMRIEVKARDSSCPFGEAPRIKVWLLPETACPDGTADPTCLASKQLSQAFSPPVPLPVGIVALDRCLPSPVPTDVFDQMYFGITAANRSGNTNVVYFRNLDAAVY
jgi:hypothetical protein